MQRRVHEIEQSCFFATNQRKMYYKSFSGYSLLSGCGFKLISGREKRFSSVFTHQPHQQTVKKTSPYFERKFLLHDIPTSLQFVTQNSLLKTQKHHPQQLTCWLCVFSVLLHRLIGRKHEVFFEHLCIQRVQSNMCNSQCLSLPNAFHIEADINGERLTENQIEQNASSVFFHLRAKAIEFIEIKRKN